MNYIICKTNAITSLPRHYHFPHSAYPKFLQEKPLRGNLHLLLKGCVNLVPRAFSLACPQAREKGPGNEVEGAFL